MKIARVKSCEGMFQGTMPVGLPYLRLGIETGPVRHVGDLNLLGNHTDQAGSHLPIRIGAHIGLTSPATVLLSVVIDAETPRYNDEPGRELAAAIRQIFSKALTIVPLQLVEQKRVSLHTVVVVGTRLACSRQE